VVIVTDEGFRRLEEEAVGRVVRAVVEDRMERPGGPFAPLRVDDSNSTSP
jgi:proteasome beta subunit